MTQDELNHITKQREETIELARTLMNAENSGRQEGEAETTQKTTQKIIEEIIRNPIITREELAIICGISADGIKWHLKKLQSQGIIRRVGPDKGGHWEIIK